MNIVVLVGHLGTDPELSTTKHGKPMCKLRLATQNKWRGSGGELQTRTDWHNLIAFGDRASIYAERLSQGEKITVKGQLSVREWYDDHETFQRRVTIKVDRIEYPVSAESHEPELEDEFFGDGFMP